MVTAVLSASERREIVREVLLDGGYPERLIAEYFPIWSAELPVSTPDFVAFTQPDQRDSSTSAVVAQVLEFENECGNWLNAAMRLAAPLTLFALPDRLELWSSAGVDAQPSRVVTANYNQRGDVVHRLSTLTPEVIERIKHEGFQPALFPVDIGALDKSRQKAHGLLASRVETAMVGLRRQHPELDETLSTKLVIGALAALTIRDKQVLSNSQISMTPAVLIDVVHQKFHGYFDWLTELSSAELDIFSGLVDEIFSDINFASFEPAMISDVYENVLSDRISRSARGSFYTPPGLAQQMLRSVPFEALEPNERSVLDPACGSGTLLLATAARLNELQPRRIDPHERHDYLTSHLRGYDRDPFAVEIAKLCMLISALPIGNSWRIDSRDTLTNALDAAYSPFVMVSNPPWNNNRETGHRVELANRFLTWMLANIADGGYIACVLPLSWLASRTSSASRTELLEKATLIEVWRLPEATFPATKSTIAPVVVVARKNRGGRSNKETTLVKTIRQGSLQNFYASGLSDEAYLTEVGQSGAGILNGPVSRFVRNSLPDFTTLGRIATIHGGRPKASKRPVRSHREGNIQELGSLPALPAFGEPDAAALPWTKMPDDYDSPGHAMSRFNQQKVVISSKRFTAEDLWRLRAGYDTTGLALREMFHMVIPDTTWNSWSGMSAEKRLYAILAVAGSGLISCWVDEREPTRNVSIDSTKAIPFPTDRQAVEELALTGRSVARAVASKKRAKIQAELLRLEKTVNRIYRLTPKVEQVIASRLSGLPDHNGVIRYERQAEPANVERYAQIPSFGTVLSSSADGLRIWVSGITDEEGTDIEAPLRAPGWVCRSGHDFTITGDFTDLRRAEYGIHRHEWLSVDGDINVASLR